MPHFIIKKIQPDEGSASFKKLVFGFTGELWWPENEKDEFLDKIRSLLKDPQRYPELLLNSCPDLRPYLVFLLYRGEIQNEAFTTLHMLAQIKASGYAKISACPLIEDTQLLNFNDVKIAQIKEKLTDKDVIYKIKMHRPFVYKHLIETLSRIVDKIEENKINNAIHIFNKNKYFLNQVLKDIPACQSSFRDLEKKLNIKIISNLIGILQEFCDTFSNQMQSLEMQELVFTNSQIPYFNYHYNAIDGWFFIFSSSSTLNTYLEVKTQQKPYIKMGLCYRTILPNKMGQAALKDVRLMNLVPYGKITDLKLHDVHVKDPFTESLHDWYHYIILAHLPKEIHEIRKHWILLLQHETGITLSHYLWRIIDAEFVACLNFNNVATNLKKCFRKTPGNFFEQNLNDSHEWHVLMVDMIVHDDNPLWKDLDPIASIQGIMGDIDIQFIKETYRRTKSLSTTAAAVYLKRHDIYIPLTQMSWKKDHTPQKNALSLYVNERCSLRDIIKEKQLVVNTTSVTMINDFIKLNASDPQNKCDTSATVLFSPAQGSFSIN